VYFAYDRDPSTINKAKNDHLLQLGAAYDFGVIKPRILYAKSQLVTPFGGTIKPTALTISATVPVSTGLIKLGYAQLNWKDGNPLLQYTNAAIAQSTTATGAQKLAAGTAGAALAAGDDSKSSKFSLGYEHTLSKRTALYTDATFGKAKGVTKANVNGVDIGIRHSF
jgi:predicted porin